MTVARSAGPPTEPDALDERRIEAALAAAGCVAPEAEAVALRRASLDGAGAVENLVARRIRGEPLAWIVGSVEFCGLRIRIDPGVFVPRPQTEDLARRAIACLRDGGVAVDLCTGSGAVAAALAAARPAATVLATDIDPVAVACARRNGVRTLLGDLDEPLPRSLVGRVDVMTAVVPYVPHEELHLLPRDVVAHEPRLALDGGTRGTVALARVTPASARWLRPGGHVLLELGGDQAAEVATMLEEAGLTGISVHRDDDGQDRAIEARRAEPAGT
ncbi:MAG TPA: HemK/PrmC family methyltransferase [Actinomycetota bacterium]|jgi:release factor glutamine methyltransferase|nr:HemK/PrmC family methyltransferase [Actinomycetota bacterium]